MAHTITDSRFTALIDQNAEVRQLGSGFTFTEGPLWHPEEKHLKVFRHSIVDRDLVEDIEGFRMARLVGQHDGKLDRQMNGLREKPPSHSEELLRTIEVADVFERI